MSDQHISPERFSPEAIDPETAANERRTLQGDRDGDPDDSITGAAESIVSTFTRPLMDDPVDEGDAERQRLLNDAEQR